MPALKSLMAGFFTLSCLATSGFAGPIRPRSWQLTYWAPNQGPPPVPVQPTQGTALGNSSTGNSAPVLAPQVANTAQSEPVTIPAPARTSSDTPGGAGSSGIPVVPVSAPPSSPIVAPSTPAPVPVFPNPVVTSSAGGASSAPAPVVGTPAPAPVVTPIFAGSAGSTGSLSLTGSTQVPPAPPAAVAPVTSTLPSPTVAPPVVPVSAPAPTPPAPSVDAFVNFGTGPYPEASLITTGNAQPWYDSAQVAKLFGGQPTDQQRADFTNAVIQRVEQTFHLSGIPVNLTTDPNVAAAHTLSVVSNTGSNQVSNAIGMSDIGANGFSFVDPMASTSTSVDQLEWVVAHNVAHELMLTFGVPETHDQTGNYIDAMNANWSMLTDPQATFSAGAASDLLSRSFLTMPSAGSQVGFQLVSAQPIPEPATWIAWSGALLAGIVVRRRLAAAKRV